MQVTCLVCLSATQLVYKPYMQKTKKARLKLAIVDQSSNVQVITIVET